MTHIFEKERMSHGFEVQFEEITRGCEGGRMI